MSQLEPPYRLIREMLQQGRVIPFLGAGASLSGRDQSTKWEKNVTPYLPNSDELASHLAQMIEFPSDEPRDLAKVAQYFQLVAGREALYRELHSIFNCNYPLTSLHTFLANISVPLLVVTTNYDNLIERAFDEKHLNYDKVIYAADSSLGERLWWTHDKSEPTLDNPNKLNIDLKMTTVIFKMHGSVDDQKPERDQYVITEDDYVEFLTRMTKNKAIPTIFAEPFKTKHFLFMGYGLRDWNLRVVLNRIGKGLPSWAIQDKPSLLEKHIWKGRGVEVYDMTIDAFVKKLQQY